jgi:hypothetical protein
MRNALNVVAIEARDRRIGYKVEIYDEDGRIVHGVSGGIVCPNALVKLKFHIGSICLPNVVYLSQIDKEEIIKRAIEKGKTIEERVDGALSIADGESNFIRPLNKEEISYLEESLRILFKR